LEIMHESAEQGVVERRFDLRVEDAIVPGLHWLPEGAAAPRPTVLIGHGGTRDKQAPSVVSLARRLVLECGYAAVALDAPGHGDRMTAEQRQAREQQRQAREQRPDGDPAGPPAGLRGAMFRAMAEATPRAVAEWRALLDDLGANPQWASGRFGYWGVSLGTAFGVPLLASEPRITAAVLGLGGLRDGDDAQRQQAASITIPLLFLLQWDDQLVTRESGLALWDALGSADKAMHVNPGPHQGVPRHERDDALAFYRRHLGS
jgi:dienelactone hydrolase